MTSTRSRPLSRLLLVLAGVAVTLLGLIAPASAAAPYCGITWGSLAKATNPSTGPFGGRLVDVRALDTARAWTTVLRSSRARAGLEDVARPNLHQSPNSQSRNT